MEHYVKESNVTMDEPLLVELQNLPNDWLEVAHMVRLVFSMAEAGLYN
jgi:hypothetical protein